MKTSTKKYKKLHKRHLDLRKQLYVLESEALGLSSEKDDLEARVRDEQQAVKAKWQDENSHFTSKLKALQNGKLRFLVDKQNLVERQQMVSQQLDRLKEVDLRLFSTENKTEALVLHEMNSKFQMIEEEQQLLLKAQHSRQALQNDKRKLFSRVVQLKSDNKVLSQKQVLKSPCYCCMSTFSHGLQLSHGIQDKDAQITIFEHRLEDIAKKLAGERQDLDIVTLEQKQRSVSVQLEALKQLRTKLLHKQQLDSSQIRQVS